MFTPQEIEAAIRATGGVPVIAGVHGTWGHFEEIDEEILEDDVRGGELGARGAVVVDTKHVQIATGIIPAPRQYDEIEVHGTLYRVVESRRVGDGAETRIWLEDL